MSRSTTARAAGARRTRWGLRLAVLAAVACAACASPAAAAEKKKGGGLSYIQFPTLTATVPHGAARSGVISVEGGIDVADASLRARAEASKPILRDAYLRWLTVYAAALAPQGAPDPDQIEGELQRATDRVLGRPGARFLIGTVLVN